jgi:AcrR family transcriptional regulator
MEYNEKQIQIMEAAERLFADKGFDGTSVRDIAEAASVNLAMISYYFGSKEKLMEAMFSYRGEGFRLQLQSTLQNDNLNSMQKVEKLIDDYIDRIFKKQCFHKVMMREQMVNKTGPIAKHIYNLKISNLELVKQLIQQGRKKGEFTKNVDVTLLMATLTGTLSQIVTAPHFYRQLNNLESISDEEFEKQLKKKLSTYLKTLFKEMLGYEA